MEKRRKKKGRGESLTARTLPAKGKGGSRGRRPKHPRTWKVRLESSDLLDGQSLAHLEIPHKPPRGIYLENNFSLDFSTGWSAELRLSILHPPVPTDDERMKTKHPALFKRRAFP